MNSLSELKEFLVSKEIHIKEFNGWSLKVGKDVWTMTSGEYYKNGIVQNMKDKNLFKSYERMKQNVEHQSTKTRKWRGISCRSSRADR
jgi:hypothetical protein